ncbi:MAG: PcfB family protein [Lachnospiraceae bacterium]
MLRSGKELKVFTVRSGDLQKFTQEAKRYGVLYCVLADRKNKDPNADRRCDCQSRGRIENQPYCGTLQL